MKHYQQKNSFAGCLIIIFMLATWGMFHVWTRTQTVELGYAISRQKAVHEQLVSDHKALNLEIATLKSTRRLELLARTELGLAVPKPEQVVYLCKDE